MTDMCVKTNDVPGVGTTAADAGTRAAGAGTTVVTVRYFAAARAASGVDEETIDLTGPATVTALLDAIGARHGAEMRRVLTRCSFLRNAVAVHDVSAVLEPSDQVDVLPPFAGG